MDYLKIGSMGSLGEKSSVIIPILLSLVVLISMIVSIIYVARTAGDEDTRNELQKNVSIIASVNLLIAIALGFLFYYYISANPTSFFPFMIIMTSFNMFVAILGVSVAALQKLS